MDAALKESAYWPSPYLVDGSKRSGCLSFEVIQADDAKVTMATFSVIEYFNVLEQIGSSLLSCSVTGIDLVLAVPRPAAVYYRLVWLAAGCTAIMQVAVTSFISRPESPVLQVQFRPFADLHDVDPCCAATSPKLTFTFRVALFKSQGQQSRTLPTLQSWCKLAVPGKGQKNGPVSLHRT